MIFRTLTTAVVVLASFELTAALRPPPAKEKWLTANSGEFRIYSNASARQTTHIVQGLTRMREAIGQITGLRVRSALPVNVYIFRDGRSFGPYRDAMVQKRDANFAGLFFSSADASFIVLRADTETVDRTVYHELTHHFFENTVSGLPLWFKEGVAEYYSTFFSRGDEVSIGLPIVDHVRLLREERMPLEAMLAVDFTSPEYNEQSRQGIFYAQSWAFVHYLIHGTPEGSRQVGEFATGIARGKPVDEAFRTAFGTDHAGLAKGLRQYLSKRLMTYKIFSLEELKIPEIDAPRPMEHADVLNVLGTMLSHASPATLGDAEAFLTEAVRVDPNFADAHAALGSLHRMAGRDAEARAALERAVSLGTKDATVYVTYGSTFLAGSPVGETSGGVARARELFERATQIDPHSARAWAALGETYVGAEGDLSAGIAALEKSISLRASQDDVAFNLLQLYARSGRREAAQKIIDTVLAYSKDPSILRHAREALLLADVARGEALYNAGKVEEALEIMKAVASATTSEELKKHLQHNIDQATQTALVNSAIAKANAGKKSEAVQILDELLPKMTDGEMKTWVKKTRDQMARAKR